jgi:SAM-dependent methyltransferase
MARYDRLGRAYSVTRRADPRIASAIARELEDARSVVNVGAGTGSYEPPQTVVAIEPSLTMIGQRPAAAAPVIQAVAEHLPLRDKSVDATLAVLTIHHWTDIDAGIAEMRRIARRRIVLLTWDPSKMRTDFWLMSEYLPGAAAADAALAVPLDRLTALLGGAVVTPVPVPHDCADGFGAAFWRRPAAYLDPAVQAGMSFMTLISPELLRPGLDRLAADLASGQWASEHADLLHREELDLGYRLVTADA